MTKTGKTLKGGGDTPVRMVDVGRGRTTKSEFCDNQVKTSKYNIITFFILNPRNSSEESLTCISFSVNSVLRFCLANLMFLISVIFIEVFLPDPPISAVTCWLPLVFVMVS